MAGRRVIGGYGDGGHDGSGGDGDGGDSCALIE